MTRRMTSGEMRRRGRAALRSPLCLLLMMVVDDDRYHVYDRAHAEKRAVVPHLTQTIYIYSHNLMTKTFLTMRKPKHYWWLKVVVDFIPVHTRIRYDGRIMAHYED
jgi:hypothetical protein